jgi:SET domain-containing protein
MFLFRTEVKVATDPRMGLGLFATEFIPKDSIVWEFVEGVDIKVSVDRVEQMSEAQQEYFEKYAWVEDDYYYSSCDLTNFVNHSYQPNLKIIDEIMISLKDIHPGEELFENYAEFDDCFDEYKDEYI